MSVLELTLSAELREELARHATNRGVSESDWVAEAIRDKISAAVQLEYLRVRAARGSRAAYDRVLNSVPAAPPDPGDEW